MRLPAKISYAYKAVLELALRYDGKAPVQLNIISQEQKIPKKFLIQLLLRLKNANIVDSSRGISGGYYLIRHPSKISLADIVKAIDDGILEGPRGVSQASASQVDKVLINLWTDISEVTARRLKEVTLDKIISKIKKEQLTYYI